jgi:hypothetical protein
MTPISAAFLERANKQFQVGHAYPLMPQESRSTQSHKHYFACVRKAWDNLSHEQLEQFPTAEHLRAWALVKSGYASETVIVCASFDDARRVAVLSRDAAKIRIVGIEQKVVTVWTPHSQSVKAMGHRLFQESKEKVLDICAGLARTTRAELKANAGEAE